MRSPARSARPRAVDVVRALALLGAVPSLGACGSGADVAESGGADAASEAEAVDAASEAAPPDAPDATEDAVDEGGDHLCISLTQPDLPCAAGFTCMISELSGYMACDTVDSGLVHACGDITCGWDCACASEASSRCACFGGVGPLPPPDLPLT